MRASPRQQLTWLLTIVAIQNIAYTILIPLVPRLRNEFHMNLLAVGIAFSGFTATKALAQPLGGWLADRLKPHGVGLTGIAIAATSTLYLSQAHSATEVLIARLTWGIGEGIAMPALLIITTDLGRTSQIGAERAIGWFGSAAVAGMALGPLIVMSLGSSATVEQAFLVGGSLSFAGVALFIGQYSYLGRRLHATNRRAQHSDRQLDTNALTGTPASPIRQIYLIVVALGVLDFVNNFIYSGLEPTLAALGRDYANASTTAISIILFIGLLIFAGAAPAAGWAAARIPAMYLTSWSFLIQSACLGLPVIVRVTPLYIGGFLTFMAAQSFVYVCLRSVLTSVKRDRLGRAVGTFGFISDLGWVSGPLLVTSLFPRPSPSETALWSLLATGATLLALLLARRTLRSQTNPDQRAGEFHPQASISRPGQPEQYDSYEAQTGHPPRIAGR